MEERHKNRIQDNLSFLVKVRNSSDYEQISMFYVQDRDYAILLIMSRYPHWHVLRAGHRLRSSPTRAGEAQTLSISTPCQDRGKAKQEARTVLAGIQSLLEFFFAEGPNTQSSQSLCVTWTLVESLCSPRYNVGDPLPSVAFLQVSISPAMLKLSKFLQRSWFKGLELRIWKHLFLGWGLSDLRRLPDDRLQPACHRWGLKEQGGGLRPHGLPSAAKQHRHRACHRSSGRGRHDLQHDLLASRDGAHHRQWGLWDFATKEGIPHRLRLSGKVTLVFC